MKRLVAFVFVVACGGSGVRGGGIYTPETVDVDRIQRACALEVSCLAPVPIAPASSCVTQFEIGLSTGQGAGFATPASALLRFIDCANRTSTCAAVLDCASNQHGPDWCNAHANPTCDGDVLYTCVSGWGLDQLDCAAVGMHCGTGANGLGSCTDGASCNPEQQPPRCDGNRYVACNDDGLEVGFDCGALFAGGLCNEVASGATQAAACLPPPCDAGSDACDGKTLIACSGGTQARIDCSQFASHCVIDATGSGTCAPDASDCPQNASDNCAGDALQICVNGTLKQTSCPALGFSTCSPRVGAAACE